MVPGSPRFPSWHDPKCQPHHLEQIHQKIEICRRVYVKILQQRRRLYLNKICCLRMMMLKTTSVLKQSTKKINCSQLSKLWKRSPLSSLYSTQRNKTYRCTLWQDLSRDLSHRISFKEAFGIQAVARTRFFWTLSPAKTNLQRDVLHNCWPLTALLQCLPAVVDLCDYWWSVSLRGLLNSKTTSFRAYLILFFCWACYLSHRFI